MSYMPQCLSDYQQTTELLERLIICTTAYLHYWYSYCTCAAFRYNMPEYPVSVLVCMWTQSTVNSCTDTPMSHFGRPKPSLPSEAQLVLWLAASLRSDLTPSCSLSVTKTGRPGVALAFNQASTCCDWKPATYLSCDIRQTGQLRWPRLIHTHR